MEQIRLLKKEDIPVSRKLWQDRFGDSDRFMDWYFQNRFMPELSAGVFSDSSKLISQAHGRPMLLRTQSGLLSVLMIGGVSTDKSFEKQGHMHRVLDFLYTFAVDSGYDALFLAAEHPEIYHSVGFFDCCCCIKASSRNQCSPFCNDSVQADVTVIEQLFKLYQKMGYKYDYSVIRNIDDMRKRIEDCFNAGFHLITFSRKKDILGYVLYDPESRTTEEIFAKDESAYRELINALPDNTSVVLPPDMTMFGTRSVLSLIKPISQKSTNILKHSDFIGYCSETY